MINAQSKSPKPSSLLEFEGLMTISLEFRRRPPKNGLIHNENHQGHDRDYFIMKTIVIVDYFNKT